MYCSTCTDTCTAMTTYTSINWDVIALPDFALMSKAMYALKNQTIYSPIRPYAESDAYTKEEHNALHSTRPNSDSSYPHSFINSPIHEIPNDYNSKIVGVTGAGFAWDFALRFLLPDNVEGIIVEILNSCNQSSLYELHGIDAFYLGENATKDSKYENMAVARDLFASTHPDYTTTPGHCYYTIVSNTVPSNLSDTISIDASAQSYHFMFYTPTAYIPQREVSRELQNKHSNDLCCCCSIYVCARSASVSCLRPVGSKS